ncbi:MAG TPA: condensation domain-containing protein, partial [Ktedonobacteraceae bacterium]|nr:condensation domain-containing protein [Ktedonobacteraceae bacterium]
MYRAGQGLTGSRLSQQQERLWTLRNEGDAYRSECAVLLDGYLDQRTLNIAIARVIAQHEILRTAFYQPPGASISMQVVTHNTEFALKVIDIQRIEASCQSGELEVFLTSLAGSMYTNEEEKPLRAWLLRLSVHNHLFVAQFSPLCADAITQQLFIEELLQAYHALLEDRYAQIEILQYADIAAWQDDLMQEEGAEVHRQHWHDRDFGLIPKSPLPFERLSDKRPGTTFAPQSLAFPLEETMLAQIFAAAQRYAVPPSSWFLTCWLLLLDRLSEEKGVVLGVACDGRIYEELERSLGLYTRFVPVKM